MTVNAAFFYLFATFTVASAFMVIASRNPVQSVLFLIFAFVNAAGLFLLMGAEFLAMILVIVYVGAVAVLFLFVVMMLDVDFAALRQGYLQYLPVGALIGVVFLLELVLIVGAYVVDPQLIRTQPSATALHSILLFLPGGGSHPARRNDRRHRADAPGARRGAAAGHLEAERPHAGNGGRGAEGSLPPRRLGDTRMIGLGHYLTVAAILFTLGVFGIFLNRKNVIVILMSVELILLAVNINFVAFSTHLNDIVGQVFALLILTVAAAEAAIGLAILVVFFRNRGSIAVEDVNMMRG